ncbi:nucleotide pyrophosphohydrolase [Oceanicoccus sp. KOV_DT_Chl]|uniref:nucleotide pyrophosphohydrolase n=1 Tax=Oceanicoccus sp. KOV_DT_Chl TaxID=1904639 RepID=UPI000C7C02AB|nr:nucleotide pyrophosphohydrolase [Oceanicoccus sp. KOV_DT_Chl]
MINTLDDIKHKARVYAAERDWEQFHTPKNLAMALSVEASELVEHFQWLSQEQSASLPEHTLAAVADEIADVQVYLVMLADKLGVDILPAVAGKMLKNEMKYPAEKVRGSARKYTEYE